MLTSSNVEAVQLNTHYKVQFDTTFEACKDRRRIYSKWGEGNISDYGLEGSTAIQLVIVTEIHYTAYSLYFVIN